MESEQIIKERGEPIRERIKQTAKNHGLDPQRAARRYAVDRVINALHRTALVPFLVKGGATISQLIRDTVGGDLQFVRQLSMTEIRKALTAAADLLALEGIHTEAVSPEPQIISTSETTPDAWRFKVEAWIGGMRAPHQLDMSFGGSFPKGLKPVDLPSFVKNGPATRCFAQPLAAMAADKWVAILTRGAGDMGVKEYADVRLLEALGTEASEIARELERVAIYRQLPSCLFKPIPDALDFDVFMKRKDRWESFKVHRRLTDRLSDVWIDLRGQWSEIHEHFGP